LGHNHPKGPYFFLLYLKLSAKLFVGMTQGINDFVAHHTSAAKLGAVFEISGKILSNNGHAFDQAGVY
jgi:hypothetical protein